MPTSSLRQAILPFSWSSPPCFPNRPGMPLPTWPVGTQQGVGFNGASYGAGVTCFSVTTLPWSWSFAFSAQTPGVFVSGDDITVKNPERSKHTVITSVNGSNADVEMEDVSAQPSTVRPRCRLCALLAASADGAHNNVALARASKFASGPIAGAVVRHHGGQATSAPANYSVGFGQCPSAVNGRQVATVRTTVAVRLVGGTTVNTWAGSAVRARWRDNLP